MIIGVLKQFKSKIKTRGTTETNLSNIDSSVSDVIRPNYTYGRSKILPVEVPSTGNSIIFEGLQVNENSLAEQCGLQVGDIIVKINDCPTVKLTHTEVHDLITSSGLNFILSIRRGIVPIDIIHEGELSLEFQDILRGIQTSVEEDIFAEAADIVEKLNKENSKKEKKMVFSNATQTQFSLEEETATKFSTFMMKPDKPIPKPKKIMEEPNLDLEPYKVVIKRQTLGRKFFKEKKVQFDQNITEVEIEARSETTEASQEQNAEENGDVDAESFEEINEQLEEENNGDEEYNMNTQYESDVHTQEREESPEIKYKPLSEIKVDSSSEFSMTLEEQLLAVQKQLQALSQLPSAIQMTLDAVSKQLASIVSAKENCEERDELEDHYENGLENSSDEERECNDETSEDEARAETNREQNEASNSSLEGDFDDDSIAEEEIKAILERARLEEGGEETGEAEEDPVEEISEEEKLAQIREQEMLAKKEKVGRWNDTWPWSDRVKPVYSESNCWRVPSKAAANEKINFLKFQPPAKNLDYLQRSEVYRLVHGMEPPVRGIVSRPEKVLPEQDYYEASKGAP